MNSRGPYMKGRRVFAVHSFVLGSRADPLRLLASVQLALLKMDCQGRVATDRVKFAIPRRE